MPLFPCPNLFQNKHLYPSIFSAKLSSGSQIYRRNFTVSGLLELEKVKLSIHGSLQTESLKTLDSSCSVHIQGDCVVEKDFTAALQKISSSSFGNILVGGDMNLSVKTSRNGFIYTTFFKRAFERKKLLQKSHIVFCNHIVSRGTVNLNGNINAFGISALRVILSSECQSGSIQFVESFSVMDENQQQKFYTEDDVPPKFRGLVKQISPSQLDLIYETIQSHSMDRIASTCFK
eukprot:Sdes_comp20656_c0_seq3m15952